MAEYVSKQVYCRYNSRGNCPHGIHCKFIHVVDITSSAGPTRSIEHRPAYDFAAESTWIIEEVLCPWNRGTPHVNGTTGRSPPSVEEGGLLGPSQVQVRAESPKYTLSTNTGQNFSGRMAQPMMQGSSVNSSMGLPANNWANAPEFVPIFPEEASSLGYNTKKPLCPYLPPCHHHSDDSEYLHRIICELCGIPCLHPYNKDQQKKHTNECIKKHEKEMKISFAIARSKDRACGICLEKVYEKNPRDQRFGILPNCTHCFCLTCIRQWRQATQFENKVIRACPECRVKSDFVCPSTYWVESKEEKDNLIVEYKAVLRGKACKYFKSGKGTCPFGNKCFYRHAYPDGTTVDVGPPKGNPRRRRRQRQHLYFWDFVEERENRFLFNIDWDLIDFFSDDSDDSDLTDHEYF